LINFIRVHAPFCESYLQGRRGLCRISPGRVISSFKTFRKRRVGCDGAINEGPHRGGLPKVISNLSALAPRWRFEKKHLVGGLRPIRQRRNPSPAGTMPTHRHSLGLYFVLWYPKPSVYGQGELTLSLSLPLFRPFPFLVPLFLSLNLFLSGRRRCLDVDTGSSICSTRS